MTMPAAPSALARTVIAMDPHDLIAQAVDHLTNGCWSRANNRSCRKQKACGGKRLERTNHLRSISVLLTSAGG
jgi:hypothetical protein